MAPITPSSFPIEAGPVILRPFETTDFDGFYACWSLPEVARYVPWVPSDAKQATVALERRVAQRTLTHDGEVLTLAAIEVARDRVVGELMLRWLEGEHEQGEVGFAERVLKNEWTDQLVFAILDEEWQRRS